MMQLVTEQIVLRSIKYQLDSKQSGFQPLRKICGGYFNEKNGSWQGFILHLLTAMWENWNLLWWRILLSICEVHALKNSRCHKIQRRYNKVLIVIFMKIVKYLSAEKCHWLLFYLFLPIITISCFWVMFSKFRMYSYWI